MSDILQRTTNTIQLAEFWENEQLKKYNYSPVYQRLSVWSEEKQSFFIDSILRNYPVPPIFLHKKIDDATGKQTFDVIDGKQRLTSIIKFINNEIPAASESSEDIDDILSGVYFENLNSEELKLYKKLFWRYELQIQYVDTEDTELIDKLFDRLNRNGEPLKGQELRRSKYHSSPLLEKIDYLSELPFWKERTASYDLARMEDKEFISELFFATIENKPLGADRQGIIDEYYQKYFDNTEVIEQTEAKFKQITTYLSSLNLDYQGYSIKGVSHLYGLWCFSQYCLAESKNPTEVSRKLVLFYEQLKGLPKIETPNANVLKYKKSMSSGTKAITQRTRRLESLVGFLAE